MSDRGKCSICKSENVVEYVGEVSQCVMCGYIAGSDEFEKGCPNCGDTDKDSIVEYDGELSQCADCHYLADASEFGS